MTTVVRHLLGSGQRGRFPEVDRCNGVRQKSREHGGQAVPELLRQPDGTTSTAPIVVGHPLVIRGRTRPVRPPL